MSLPDYQKILTFLVPVASALSGAYFGAWAAQRNARKSKSRDDALKELRGINAAIIVSFTICNNALGLMSQLVRPMCDRFERDKKKFQESLTAGQPPPHLELDFVLFSVPPFQVDRLQELLFQEVTSAGESLGLVPQIEDAIDGLRKAVDRRAQIAASFRQIHDPFVRLCFYFGQRLANGETNRELCDLMDVIQEYANDVIWFSQRLCGRLEQYGYARRDTWVKEHGSKFPGINSVDFSSVRSKGLIPPDERYSSFLKWYVQKGDDSVRATPFVGAD